ncbi:MAG: GHKL domain-containing protein [Chlorobi bacterium]|nr:GHKL domain-containing protein [Chlorobiota bacterium]
MIYKKFSYSLLLRLFFLLATLTALAFVIVNIRNTNWIFTTLTLTFLVLLQVYNLVHFVTKTNRDYARFLISVKNGDYISNYRSSFKDSGYKEFYSSLTEVLELFRKVKIEKEAQFQYLRQIMRQLNVGVIAFDRDGVIEVMNQMATRLLRTIKVDHWDKLKTKTPEFYEIINSINKKDKRLADVIIKGEKKQFLIEVNTVLLINKEHKVVTFQNIKSEVETKEIEAWHKLIRTMAHEIMNSLTPITSLTETSVMLLQDEKGRLKQLKELTEKTISNLSTALKTIQSRTNGLLEFIGNYRKLTRVPTPKMRKIRIDDLFKKTETLMAVEAKKQNVTMQCKVFQKNLTVNADSGQIEQVLINLITNSLAAVENVISPKIIISAFAKDESVIIEVIDNGVGINPDKVDKIFIPFFSTKPLGTGIGLSLSKQIMKKHKGDIEVFSIPGEKTTFSLYFPL